MNFIQEQQCLDGCTGIDKIIKEMLTLSLKKYTGRKWVSCAQAILGIECVAAEMAILTLNLWCGRKGLI